MDTMTWTDERMDDLRREMDSRFDRVDKQFERVDKQFERVDRRFERVEARLDAIMQSNVELHQAMSRFGLGILVAMTSLVAAQIGLIATQL